MHTAEPATDYVMTFLGPVTRLDGRLVRPHDLELFPTAQPDAVPAVVRRVLRVGFEVRVDLTTAAGQDVWVQVTRGEADRLAVQPGRNVHLRPVTGAVSRPCP